MDFVLPQFTEHVIGVGKMTNARRKFARSICGFMRRGEERKGRGGRQKVCFRDRASCLYQSELAVLIPLPAYLRSSGEDYARMAVAGPVIIAVMAAAETGLDSK